MGRKNGNRGSAFHRRIDLAHVGAVGHSAGGRAVENLAVSDRRVDTFVGMAGASVGALDEEAPKVPRKPGLLLAATADGIVGLDRMDAAYDAMRKPKRIVYFGGVRAPGLQRPVRGRRVRRRPARDRRAARRPGLGTAGDARDRRLPRTRRRPDAGMARGPARRGRAPAPRVRARRDRRRADRAGRGLPGGRHRRPQCAVARPPGPRLCAMTRGAEEVEPRVHVGLRPLPHPRTRQQGAGGRDGGVRRRAGRVVAVPRHPQRHRPGVPVALARHDRVEHRGAPALPPELPQGLVAAGPRADRLLLQPRPHRRARAAGARLHADPRRRVARPRRDPDRAAPGGVVRRPVPEGERARAGTTRSSRPSTRRTSSPV